MSKSFILIFVCISIGIGIGYALFSQQKSIEEKMPMKTEEEMDVSTIHNHPMTAVDDSLPTPALQVEVIKDTKDGYNFHVVTENYVFTPLKVNELPVQGEGHAHIYINGIKLGRLYGEWFHLSNASLKDGVNSIEVTLNANDHSEWVIGEKHISAVVEVTK